LISFFIFTAKAQRAQRKDTFLLPLRGRQKKKNQSLRDIFFTITARRACFLLFSVLSTENNKINNLSDLCDSNERSEWAVSYRI